MSDDHAPFGRSDASGPDGTGPGAAGGDVVTLLRTMDLGPRRGVDVDAILAEGRRRRRFRAAERMVAVAATVALVSGIGLGVVRLGGAPAPTTTDAVALPPTALGSSTSYPYAVQVGSSTGTTVVLWLDPQCPLCGRFETEAGSSLRALATQGRIRLVIRPVTFLDDAHPESHAASQRAVAAWGCVLAADPATGDTYLGLLLTHQPAVEGAGWTDTQLLAYAARALGATSPSTSLRHCVESGTYVAWAKAASDQLALQGISGTPTVLVNGTPLADVQPFEIDPAAWLAEHT